MKRYEPVKVRNVVLGDGIPKVCIPIVAADWEELRLQTAKTAECRPDLVEWRVDYYREWKQWEQVEKALVFLRSKLGECPVLFTFRSKAEGGEAEITWSEYETLCLRAARQKEVDLIDLEYHMGEEKIAELIRNIKAYQTGCICSFHDFKKTCPANEIIRQLCCMQQMEPDLTKMALMPQTREDVLRLLEASVSMDEKWADRPFITMSMGRLGSISRLAGGLTGSAVTFASAGQTSAPGQMSAAMVSEALRML